MAIRMRYLVTLVAYLWFTTALVAAESNEAPTTEKQKEDCVFEVLPRHGANKDQLDRDLDAKLAQFDACLDSIENGTLGRRRGLTARGKAVKLNRRTTMRQEVRLVPLIQQTYRQTRKKQASRWEIHPISMTS